MELHYSFGSWLRRNRKSLDLTQAELANQVGCSAASIRKIEAEERRPSAQIVDRLAEIFNIPQNERTAFLRFARGDWKSGPSKISVDIPWRISNRAAISNLPSTTTILIGRELEITLVCEYLLNPVIRLITLVGPPGIGKTRLSIAAARATMPDFPDGVFFIALAALDNPILLAPSIAQAMSYVEIQNLSSIEQLIRGIGDKQMLLVLDNCEHLIEDVASLAHELLSSCPGLKLLATSRESLRISGEWLYPVPALNFPKEDLSIDLASAAEFPALTLFTERARAVRSDFALDINNIATVSTICSHLDGLPLAIELIAARLRLMSPQSLLERLNDKFILSVDGMRTGSVRQKTLHNAIGWSYNLLSAEEQTVFARLAVFSGGFTLIAAEAILSRTATEKSVSDLISSLFDKSVLQRTLDARGEPRFTMLTIIQQFALDCLRRAGEEAEIREWHRTYFLNLAEKADHEINGPYQIEWLGRLYADRDNLRSALEWMIELGQTEAALKMARNLFWFWFMRSDLNEGRRWLGRVVTLPDASLYPESYADALSHLANLTWYQVGPKEARPFVEQALAVARGREDTRNIAHALLILGLVLTTENNFTTARSTLEESRALFHALGDEWNERAHVVLILSMGPYLQKDWTTSLALYEEALAGFRKFGDIFFQTVALRFVGNLRVKQGDMAQGMAAFREALILAQQLESKSEIAAILWSLGDATQCSGNYGRSVRLFWTAKNIYTSIGAWGQEEDAEFANILNTIRVELEESEFAASMEQGRSMTMQQAIAFALEQSDW
jgi:predicted ATPase/transcriptional regulator with XRE-family HTH domain